VHNYGEDDLGNRAARSINVDERGSGGNLEVGCKGGSAESIIVPFEAEAEKQLCCDLIELTESEQKSGKKTWSRSQRLAWCEQMSGLDVRWLPFRSSFRLTSTSPLPRLLACQMLTAKPPPPAQEFPPLP
jgi:hypothetical protein